MKTLALLLFFGVFMLEPISGVNAEDINFIWAERAGGAETEESQHMETGRDVLIDREGDLLVVGTFIGTATFGATTVTSMSDKDAFIAKYGTNGNLFWIRHFGGNMPSQSHFNGAISVATDADNNVIAVGQYGGPISSGDISFPFNGGIGDLFLVKYDTYGNLIWAKTVNGNEWECAYDVATDDTGNIFITGTFSGGWAKFDDQTLTTYGGDDIFVAKYDPDGNLLWVKQAGGSESGKYIAERGRGIAIDADGDIIITGMFSGTAMFGTTALVSEGSYDIFVTKYDTDGNFLWAKGAGGSGRDAAHGLVLDTAGNSYITGQFKDTADFGDRALTSVGIYDIFVAKYDPVGNLLWVQTAGGLEKDRGQRITIDDSGNLFVIGEFQTICDFSGTALTSMGSSDIFIAKYDSDGYFYWAQRAGGTGVEEVGFGIILDAFGKGYITGRFSETADFGELTLASAGGSDIFLASFGPSNHPPTANAGDNITVLSEQIVATIIQGTATDEDPDDVLEYRWKEGETILLNWTSVGENGECPLDLSIMSLEIGQHTSTIEVTDGQDTSSDEMILTIDNSAPHPAPTGGGVYEVNTEVTLGGNVSDFDGDLVHYEWLEEGNSLFNGTVQTIVGGDPANLPVNTLYPDLGSHIFTLRVDDMVNPPVEADIEVIVQDTMDPTLAPVPDKTILWPPNHKMVDITIEANASDNSGGTVTLSAVVTSNEPQDGLGDGDQSPDWTEPVIDQENGIITLQLRSERSGSGDGRVYTITITATDDSNNSSTADVEIIVPHDKRKK